MLTIKIDTGNSAFDGFNYHSEVARVLTALAGEVRGRRIDTRGQWHDLRDAHGNTVGTLTVTGSDKARL
jgi:hypothetical protein